MQAIMHQVCKVVLQIIVNEIHVVKFKFDIDVKLQKLHDYNCAFAKILCYMAKLLFVVH
jgi:hypothetical protein